MGGYQLSLDNFLGARNRLKGPKDVADRIIGNSAVGLTFDFDLNINFTSLVTSTYDVEDAEKSIAAMDKMQLDYVCFLVSDEIKKRALDDYLLKPRKVPKALSKKIYDEVNSVKISSPLIIMDLDKNLEYTLMRCTDGDISKNRIEMRKIANPFEDKYLKFYDHKATNLGHYYDIMSGGLSKEEADIIVDNICRRRDLNPRRPEP